MEFDKFRLSRVSIFAKPAVFALAALAIVSLSALRSSAAGLGDYVSVVFQPTVFSKTTVVGDETFYTTIKGTGTVKTALPAPIAAVTYTFKYIGTNKATGDEVTLNPSRTLKISPYPQKVGDSYTSNDTVPLQFPAGSEDGVYVVTEEVTNIAFTKPPAPTAPTAPTNTQTAPTKPSPPAGCTPETCTQPQKPPEPTAPTQPSQPSEPTGPTQPAQPTAPPEPRNLGTVTYVSSSTPAPEPAVETPPVEPEQAPAAKAPALPLSSLKVVDLAVTPSYLFYGIMAKLTVTLNGAAPAGGIIVPTAFAPGGYVTESLYKGIMVDAGQSTGSFNLVPPRTQPSPVDVTITASMNGSKKSVVLKVGPTYKGATLIVSPDTVSGGASSAGAVALDKPAPVGGQTVTLSASPAAAVTIPSKVTVKAGETWAAFDIQTKKVTSQTKVAISAKSGSCGAFGGSGNCLSKSASLTINPQALSAFTVSPSSILNGGKAVGTVTLNGAAPSGGQAVSIASPKDAPFTFPASVTVKAGATAATFDIVTKKVSGPMTSSLSATVNGASLSAALEVHPMAIASFVLTPASVVNGATSVGTVTLSDKALTGSQVVKLLSGENFPVTLPGAVTVKAGSDSVTFNIATRQVPSTVKLTIQAALDNSYKNAQLTIEPTVIKSLTLDPAAALDGKPSVGTVTLNAPALPGGAVVQLTTDPAGLATVPASVKVKTGETSSKFDIQTKAQPLTRVVSVIASLNGSQQVAILTLGPSVRPTTCPYTCRAATYTSTSWSGYPHWITKCNSDEVMETQVPCPSVAAKYRCGWFMSCNTQAPAVCCRPK